MVGTILLATAAGGPYVLLETPAGKQLTESVGLTAAAPNESSAADHSPAAFWMPGMEWPNHSGQVAVPGSNAPNPNGLTAYGAQPQGGYLGPSMQYGLPGLSQSVLTQNGSTLIGPPIQALREVVRFDISPNWVPQRFPRVSTVLADTHLDGLRVPLVTGTTPSDLAGTLTYYFDHYQRVQRITIHAMTGDPSRFVAELQHAYQLHQQPSLGGGLYLKKWNGRPTSVVYTAPAPVISADDPYSRYQFFAELNQAGLEYGLSNEAQQLLAAGQQTNRWQ